MQTTKISRDTISCLFRYKPQFQAVFVVFKKNIYLCMLLYSQLWASLVAHMVKNLPVIWETWVQSLGWEDSPGGGHGNALQYSCLENPHGQRSQVGYSPCGHKELDTTERLSTSTGLVVAHVLSSCRAWAQQLWWAGPAAWWHVMSSFPESPALQGRFLTSEPPRKSHLCLFSSLVQVSRTASVSAGSN